MLSIYRRHVVGCTKSAEITRNINSKCACPIHVEGKLDRMYRESLNTKDWAVALGIMQSWTVAGCKVTGSTIGGKGKPLSEALALWVTDAKQRGSKAGTLLAYTGFEKIMLAYATEQGLLTVQAWTPEAVAVFRNSWTDKRRTVRNKVWKVKQFFTFASDHMGWVKTNPAAKLKTTKRTAHDSDEVVQPFTSEEMEAIKGTAYRTDEQVYAFVLAGRYLGLRLSDLVRLGPDEFKGDELKGRDGAGFLTQKASTRVSMPVDGELLAILRALPVDSNGLWFASTPRCNNAGSAAWGERVKGVFERAGVKGHPHMLRHTFAVAWLDAGLSLAEVSKLLGHKSVRVTEEYYAKFTREQSNSLAAKMRLQFKGGVDRSLKAVA